MAVVYYNRDFYEVGLGQLPVATIGKVGQAAGIAGGLSAGLASAGILSGATFGSIIPGIGTAIGAIAGLIAGLFGQHAQKVAVENKVSGQWAAQGPATISELITQWQQGQIDSATASSGLDSILLQFQQMNAPITKYNGQTGAFPDPNQPRPSSNCNWACGTYWDLSQEIAGLKGQIAQAPGLNVGGLPLDPTMLLLIGGALALLVLAK